MWCRMKAEWEGELNEQEFAFHTQSAKAVKDFLAIGGTVEVEKDVAADRTGAPLWEQVAIEDLD